MTCGFVIIFPARKMPSEKFFKLCYPNYSAFPFLICDCSPVLFFFFIIGHSKCFNKNSKFHTSIYPLILFQLMRIIVLNSKENLYFGRKKNMPLAGPFRKIRFKIQNGSRRVPYFQSILGVPTRIFKNQESNFYFLSIRLQIY
jgi:hypothetical protein